MKILALDTSSITATVALLDDNKLIGEYTLNYKKDHSQRLMPMIEGLLRACDTGVKEIDVFAVSLGPGSFTGLRIGIATMATMAQALDKQIVGVPTLEALAHNLHHINGLICPIIDGQRDQVYTGLYRWLNGKLVEIMENQLIKIDRLIDILGEKEDKIYFLGDGLDRFAESLREGLGDHFLLPPARLQIPSASTLGQVAKNKIKEGILLDIVPIYMRRSQAEIQYEKKMKGRE